MKKFFGDWTDGFGNKISGATVSVYNTGTLVAATIYQDDEVSTITGLTTNTYGEYAFKINDGVYDIVLAKSDYTTRTITAVELYDESDLKAALQALTGFDFIQNSSTTGTPSAGGSGEYWLDLLDGTVYLSTGSGTGNWGSGAYQLPIFNSDGDVNFANGYALALQNLLDQVPLSFKFNGSTSQGIISNSAVWEPTTGDFAVCVWFKTPEGADYSSGAIRLLTNRNAGSNGFSVYINTDNKVYVQYDSGSAFQAGSDAAINDGKWHVVFGFWDRSGNLTLTLDNIVQSNSVAIDATDISTGNNFYVGSWYGSAFFNGEMLPPRLFNFIPSAAERKLLANPLAQIPWYMKGATNVGQTSGTLTKGKKYRTSTFVAGDDFSNIASTGASANVTGAEWFATGTTPTTWTNSSELHPLGAVIAPDWKATTRDASDLAKKTPMLFGSAPAISWTSTELGGQQKGIAVDRLALPLATAESSVADQIQLTAKDSSDGSTNATLELTLEQAVEAIGTFTASHKLKIWINGVEYWIQLDAV